MMIAAALLATAAAAAAPTASPEPRPALARTLTLEEALQTARALQPQLRQAAAQTDAAVARADQSLAPLLPQVMGTGIYERTTGNFAPRPGSLPSGITGENVKESWNTSNFYNFGATANQLLYDFGQTSSRWKSAQASVSAQRDSQRTTLEQVLFSVRTAFFQARAARGLVGVATETLVNQQKHLVQTQAFVEVGTQAPIALAQSKTDVANARVQLTNAENGYETAKAELNLAMGVEGPTDYEVADDSSPVVPGEDGTTQELVEEANQARPELAALANQIRAQELTVRAAKGSYGPSLGLSTTIVDTGKQIDGLIWNWNAAVNLSIPIFLGGLTKAQVHEAEANLASIRAQFEIEKQQVRLDVEQARLAVRAAKAALEASGEALVNAQEQLKLAEGRYETGVGSIIELGDAQVAQTSAGQQEVQAQYNLAQARAQLVRALGRG